MSYELSTALDAAQIDDLLQDLYQFDTDMDYSGDSDGSELAEICGGDPNWSSYFDSMSGFDADDYEYQQGLLY